MKTKLELLDDFLDQNALKVHETDLTISMENRE